ncbi:unnamed protein product, partial [Lota lota]
EFLACRPEQWDLDLDGDKAAICYKEIHTALRQNLIRKRLDKHAGLDYEVLGARPSLTYEEQGHRQHLTTINTLLLNELPQFNGLALGMMWSVLGAFSSLHLDLTSEMEQLFQGFAQQ